MSKIQKALDAIRKSPDTVERTEPALRRRSEPASAVARSADGDAEFHIELITPKSQVEVDHDALIAAGLLPPHQDRDLIGRQFRRAKRPVLQCAFDDPTLAGANPNIIMMASAMPGAGKSFCSFNLAYSIAYERDYDSLLVDADVLKPGLSRALGLDDRPGLTDYLLDDSLEIGDVLVGTDLNDILVIPAGRSHPEATELLASRRMREMIETLSAAFASRAVIFDTPPLLLTSEAQVLAAKAGQIVYVLEARSTSQDSALRAVSLLDREKPINAILNKSRSASGAGYQSDDYGYYPNRSGSSKDESEDQ